MLKSQKLLLSLVLVAAVLFAVLSAFPLAYAEELPPDTVTEASQEPDTGDATPETPTDEETPDDGVTGLVDRFIENLKDKYGADYEYYLNAILEQWGSVEAYLLSLTDNLPDEFQAGYNDVVGWLGKYAVIWAPCLAIVLVVVCAIFGKRLVKKILDKITELFVKPIENKLKLQAEELNKQSEATAALLKSNRALLGTNEKFAEERKAAETAEKKLLE